MSIANGLDAFFQNLRYTSRKLVRNPGSSAAAVVAMALGIALTAWMYAIVDGILLRGLPYEEAGSLLHLERNNLSRDIDSMEVTQHDFEAWREQQQSFEGIAGFTLGTFNLADEDLPERYEGAWISAEFLDLLRVEPLHGRGFTAADEQPGSPSVILLGHHVWRKRYGSDPRVIGRVIRVNSEATTVVGVLPEDFLFPIRQDAWKPLILETHELRRGEGLTLEVFGRLKDGASVGAAANEMAIIAGRLEQEYPDTNEGVGSVVKPYIHEYVGEDTRMLMGVMMASVLLVLLIACFNVANLLIGRASLRGRELAVRSALGSSRWQTIAQVLSEAALVAAAGTVFGVIVANFGLRLFDTALATTEPPFWFVFELSPRVLLVVAGVATVSALISGIIPALQASRPDVGQILQDTSRGSTSFRLGKVTRFLVVAEVAGSCALLLGAGLAVRSILAQNSYDLRFETDHLINARIGLFEGDYPEGREPHPVLAAAAGESRVARRSGVRRGRHGGARRHPDRRRGHRVRAPGRELRGPAGHAVHPPERGQPRLLRDPRRRHPRRPRLHPGGRPRQRAGRPGQRGFRAQGVAGGEPCRPACQSVDGG